MPFYFATTAVVEYNMDTGIEFYLSVHSPNDFLEIRREKKQH